MPRKPKIVSATIGQYADFFSFSDLDWVPKTSGELFRDICEDALKDIRKLPAHYQPK